MSTVIAFPFERCSRPAQAIDRGRSADVMILPVVRVERHFGPVRPEAQKIAATPDIRLT